MNRVASRTAQERSELFRATTEKMPEIAPAIIEKDFWVCWTLKRLFGHPALGDDLIFKGGTSLSKVYGAIDRFSEDIDISINRALLGFMGERDPDPARSDLSNKKRQKLLEEMGEACTDFVCSALKERLEADFAGIIDDGSGTWNVSVDETDPDQQTLRFHYPTGEEPLPYIQPFVRLEFGCRSDTWPTEQANVRAYCAEHFPDTFEDAACPVTVLTAARTFWEKATILHQEYHRPIEKPLPVRHSRHYYDMAMLAGSEHKTAALADLKLLKRVVEHKMAFFRCGWAKYDLAMPGTLRLSPIEERLPHLKDDYAAMNVMLFGEIPKFDDVLNAIEELEQEINFSFASARPVV